MTDDQRKMFSFCISGVGDEDRAGYHITLLSYPQNIIEEEIDHYRLKVKLDGGQYDSPEWIREVLAGIIESL